MAESCTSMRERLVEFSREFDRWLDAALSACDGVPRRLLDSMRYSALAPGKRIRPFVLVRSCEIAGGSREDARSAAVAIECVHAFSLIHDDLPAMDNDDVRRGQPTNHRKFDEATAILAGDGLLTLAFEILTRGALDTARGAMDGARGGLDAARTVRLVRQLSEATGPAGMIGGQMLDIAGESQSPSAPRVKRIHEMKTARLFEAAARMGADCADADEPVSAALARYGHGLGLTFQIADDLLDLTATLGDLGKHSGKDQAAGKQTYPACIGEEPSREEARRLAESTIRCLDAFGPEADDLRELTRLVVERRS
ncbi:MAG: polyprenyl synthetase family protein [Phycisphaerales bacterium]|nr:polyprenyl synthetase family protein [Phycisphaerales bacterium]